MRPDLISLLPHKPFFDMINKVPDVICFYFKGNYGNSLDTSITQMPSSTHPTAALYDGVSSNYLPWDEIKPYCLIESHWEDIRFRLESMNHIHKIAEKIVC